LRDASALIGESVAACSVSRVAAYRHLVRALPELGRYADMVVP